MLGCGLLLLMCNPLVISLQTATEYFAGRRHKQVSGRSAAKRRNLLRCVAVVSGWSPSLLVPQACYAELMDQQWASMLQVAIKEARIGLAEGGLPIGAAMFTRQGELLSSGRNRRVQQGDPSVHGETDAFRRAGRLRSYREVVMVTTLAPCWYCSGLVRQFGIRTLVVGESRTFSGGLEWLRSLGVQVIDLNSEECFGMMQRFIRDRPEVWNEDIGEE